MIELSGSNSNRSMRGFTLIEMMIAITLGILLSVGLVTLFGATNKTNRAQDAMAKLQENGRYAIQRLNYDLRMMMHQSTQNTSGYSGNLPTATTDPSGASSPVFAADVYVASLPLPDMTGALNPPGGWPAATPWPLSQRYLLQGYECSTGTCSPAVPPGLPATGASAGNRVTNADVLTIRYLNADGWSLDKGELIEATSSGTACQGGSVTSITITPALGSPAFNFQSGDYAMLVAGARAMIFQVNVAGAVITPTNVIGTVPCFAQPTATSGASTSATVYNYSQDFITTTFYLRYVADPNIVGRFIPVLTRRQSNIRNMANVNGVNDQDIIQGAEQMDFLYSVDRRSGVGTATTTSYLTAADTDMQAQSSTANCPEAPYQYLKNGLTEPQCLWRAVKNVEVHLLLDSVTDQNDLVAADMAYHYSPDGSTQTPKVPPIGLATFPSGLKGGWMLRREFVELVALRNYNP